MQLNEEKGNDISWQKKIRKWHCLLTARGTNDDTVLFFFKCEIRRDGPVKQTQEELEHLSKLH